MAVTETSKQAYAKLRKLGDKQRKVHIAIGELGIASDDDILQYLDKRYPNENWTINSLTPRRNEIQKYGYIAINGRKMGRFGNQVKTYHCIDPNDKRLNRGE